MADVRSVKMNGEVNNITYSEFANKVHKDWVKTATPNTVVTCETPPGVSISSDHDLNSRIIGPCSRLCWSFLVKTHGKQLRRVALTLDDHRENFWLYVVRKNGKECGITNGQEWYDQDALEKTNSNKNDEMIQKIVEYDVKVGFECLKFGAYWQNIIFDFGDYPVILRRICKDSVNDEDVRRMSEALHYHNLLTVDRWNESTYPIVRFESPFVPPREPKEVLSATYPFPDRHHFFLSSATLSDTQLTRKNYRGRLHELINVEEIARHEQISRYNEISLMRVSSHYIVASAGDGSTTAKYAPPGELFAQLPLDRHISEDTKSGRLFLRGCNSILIKRLSKGAGTGMIFEARLEDKCTQAVYARLSIKCVQMMELRADMEIKVQVQFVLNRLPFCEWHRAVDSLSDTNVVFPDRNTKPDEQVVKNQLEADNEVFENYCAWSNLKDLLNEQQKSAIKIIASSSKLSLPSIILLGPFGTGKTFTIAQAIFLLLMESPRNKILLCTHSNSAADLYVKEFFDSRYKSTRNKRLKPLRIYYTGRATNTVHTVVREYCLLDPVTRSFREPTQQDLEDFGLIITTLSTASMLTSLDFSPTHVIIDEAAQAFECELFTPLTLACRDTSLVFAGDQMQLAPEIYSDLANECGFGISILERIHKLYASDHACRIHLRQNYRAHESIIKFTSLAFYGGLIVPAGTLKPHPQLSPLCFYAVSGEETQSIHSTGYVHDNEATEIANRVNALKSSWPVDRWGPYGEGSIGVLAYYGEQVQRIRCELRKRKLYNVSVERVLNVQGKQFTAVFISTVRTRNCCRYAAETNMKDYGFLTNPKLLNTAVTRAKCLVAVVGDPVALLTIGRCKNLWGKYFEMAAVCGVDRNALAHDLRMVPQLPPVARLNPLAEEFVPRNRQPTSTVEYVPVPCFLPVMRCSPDW